MTQQFLFNFYLIFNELKTQNFGTTVGFFVSLGSNDQYLCQVFGESLKIGTWCTQTVMCQKITSKCFTFILDIFNSVLEHIWRGYIFQFIRFWIEQCSLLVPRQRDSSSSKIYNSVTVANNIVCWFVFNLGFERNPGNRKVSYILQFGI